MGNGIFNLYEGICLGGGKCPTFINGGYRKTREEYLAKISGPFHCLKLREKYNCDLSRLLTVIAYSLR